MLSKVQKDPILILRNMFEDLGHPVSGIYEITPEVAAEIMQRNTDNRKLRDPHIKKIASDIRDGLWKINGETIIIADTDDVNDGQHRLLAIIEAGMAASSMIVYGVERETRSTIDLGIPRSVGDLLGMEKIPNYNLCATIAGQLLRWDAGVDSQKGKSEVDSKSAIMAFFHQHRREIEKAIKETHHGQLAVRHLGGAPLVAFTWVLLCRKAGEEAARNFWDQIISGANLRDGSPLLYVRNRFMRDTRMPRPQRIEVIFRAWNAWREGREVKTLPVIGQIPDLI